MRAFKCILVLAIVSGLSACVVRNIEEDYPQYLAATAGRSNLPRTNKVSEYYIKAATQQFSYVFHAWTTGIANQWTVAIGKMLDDTLKSTDVQEAFYGLQKVSNPTSTSGGLLTFDLRSYYFKGFEAYISIEITFSRSGKVIFSRLYTEVGKSQGSKMFFGGGFAQKNAVQQSTKLALDKILRALIADLNTVKG